MAERTTVLFVELKPIGLKVEFSLLDDACIGLFTPQTQLRFDNLTHGGILFSLLDDDGELGWLQEKMLYRKSRHSLSTGATHRH